MIATMRQTVHDSGHESHLTRPKTKKNMNKKNEK